MGFNSARIPWELEFTKKRQDLRMVPAVTERRDQVGENRGCHVKYQNEGETSIPGLAAGSVLAGEHRYASRDPDYGWDERFLV